MSKKKQRPKRRRPEPTVGITPVVRKLSTSDESKEGWQEPGERRASPRDVLDIMEGRDP